MANSFLLPTFCDKKAVINLTGAPDSKFQEYVCSKLLLNNVNVSQGSVFSSPLRWLRLLLNQAPLPFFKLSSELRIAHPPTLDCA